MDIRSRLKNSSVRRGIGIKRISCETAVRKGCKKADQIKPVVVRNGYPLPQSGIERRAADHAGIIMFQYIAQGGKPAVMTIRETQEDIPQAGYPEFKGVLFLTGDAHPSIIP